MQQHPQQPEQQHASSGSSAGLVGGAWSVPMVPRLYCIAVLCCAADSKRKTAGDGQISASAERVRCLHVRTRAGAHERLAAGVRYGAKTLNVKGDVGPSDSKLQLPGCGQSIGASGGCGGWRVGLHLESLTP